MQNRAFSVEHPMSSSPDQNLAAHADSQAGAAVAEGYVGDLSLQREQGPVAAGGLDLAAWNPGSDKLWSIQAEWMGRQAELWYGMLQRPVDAPASDVAETDAGDQRIERPPARGNPMFDYLRQACLINASYVKSMASTAPVADEQAKDHVRTLTAQMFDAMAPSSFLGVESNPVESSYLDIRDTLKSGDIVVASKGNIKSFNNFLSLLIRVFTASSYSHVGVVVKLGNRCFVVEATPPVVRLFPLSKLDSFYVIKMEQDWSTEDENRLFEYVGLPYSDWNSIVSYFTRRPLANGKLQCAQLVSSFYRWPNLLRPEQIVRYAQETLGKRMIFVR